MAIFSSCGRTVTESGGARPWVSRTSSGQYMVCSVITSSWTRSTASDSRVRSAILVTATRSVCFSVSRSRTYGLWAAGLSGAR
ncbi:hypothetical protein GCM10010315_08630 [Streptomyces luteosporeus]|uniref:YTH domain-containing protein n=1 Tax=Streptomyces luteosporeus TaxID=173856 RepID=A0ABP6G1A3_9ACTN